MDQTAGGGTAEPGRGVDDSRLVAAVGLVVVRLTLQSVVAEYSPAAGLLLGWTGDSAVGRPFGDLVIEHEDGTVEESLGSTVAAGRRWVGQVRLQGHSRRIDSVHATTLPLHDPEGRATGARLLALEPDSVLWPLLTGRLDGWLVHSNGRVKYADPHATRLLGGPGLDLQVVRVLVADRPAPEPLAEVLVSTSDGEGDGGAEPLELQVVTASSDASGRWVEATITAVKTEGPRAGVVWRLRDVTGRRRLAHTQEALSAELRSALDSRVVIEQAKGFLAGRDGVSTEAAFRRLRRHARDHNLALRDVARRLVAGELSLEPTGPEPDQPIG
jgi:PAS domain-containing protein